MSSDLLQQQITLSDVIIEAGLDRIEQKLDDIQRTLVRLERIDEAVEMLELKAESIRLKSIIIESLVEEMAAKQGGA